MWRTGVLAWVLAMGVGLFTSANVMGSGATLRPPVLVSPESGATAYADSLLFRWTHDSQNLDRSDRLAVRFTLCVALPGTSCAAGGNGVWLFPGGVYGGIPQTFASARLPVELRGRVFNWTVAACLGQQCVYQGAARAVIFSATPPAPTLERPWNEARGVGSSETFEWTATPGATHYTLCVSLPGVSCGTGTSIVINNIKGTSVAVGFLDRVAGSGTELHWTASACREQTCTTQLQVRRLFLAPQGERRPHLWYLNNGPTHMDSSGGQTSQVWALWLPPGGYVAVAKACFTGMSTRNATIRWKLSAPSAGAPETADESEATAFGTLAGAAHGENPPGPATSCASWLIPVKLSSDGEVALSAQAIPNGATGDRVSITSIRIHAIPLGH